MQVIKGPSAGTYYPSEDAVKLFPINAVIGPTEILVLAASEILLADATDVNKALHGAVTIQNLGPNPIYIAFATSASSGPGVTTANGIEIAVDLSYTVDLWGGSAIWARTSVDQTAGNGTRVIGTKKT